MVINELGHLAKRTFHENNTAILTGVGVSGTVATAVLTGRATAKAVRMIDRIQQDQEDFYAPPFENKVLARYVLPLYIPAVGVGTVTVVSIVMANRLATKQATALAAAYGLSERAFTEYKNKVVEHMGEGKEQKVRDAVAQDRVTNASGSNEIIILAGDSTVLCMDSISGRYFKSTVEQIQKAVNKINFDITNHSNASLSSFYDEIGLTATEYSDEVGWNLNQLLEVFFTTAKTPDDRPCLVMTFSMSPIHGYGQLF